MLPKSNYQGRMTVFMRGILKKFENVLGMGQIPKTQKPEPQDSQFPKFQAYVLNFLIFNKKLLSHFG